MTPAAGRILALDLGEVRVGLAISDPLGITAQPLGTFSRRGPRPDRQRVAELVREHEVSRVIVGDPLLLSGESGERSRDAREFARRLGGYLPDVDVELWDERLTSKEADRAMIAGGLRRGKRRERIDELAAVLILQSWLDAAAARAAGDGNDSA